MHHHLSYLGCSGGAIPVTLHPLGFGYLTFDPMGNRRLYSSTGLQGAERRKVFKIAAALHQGLGGRGCVGESLVPHSSPQGLLDPAHRTKQWLRRESGCPTYHTGKTEQTSPRFRRGPVPPGFLLNFKFCQGEFCHNSLNKGRGRLQVWAGRWAGAGLSKPLPPAGNRSI